jgi:hypothetical protein
LIAHLRRGDVATETGDELVGLVDGLAQVGDLETERCRS